MTSPINLFNQVGACVCRDLCGHVREHLRVKAARVKPPLRSGPGAIVIIFVRFFAILRDFSRLFVIFQHFFKFCRDVL